MKIIAVGEDVSGTFIFQVRCIEKEINQYLSRYCQDMTTLPHELVENSYLAQEGDGSQYWLLQTETQLWFNI